MDKFKDPTEFIYKLAQPYGHNYDTPPDFVMVYEKEDNKEDMPAIFFQATNAQPGKLKAPIKSINNELINNGIIGVPVVNVNTPPPHFMFMADYGSIDIDKLPDFTLQLTITANTWGGLIRPPFEFGVDHWITALIECSNNSNNYIQVIPLKHLAPQNYAYLQANYVSGRFQEVAKIELRIKDILKTFPSNVEVVSITIKGDVFQADDFSKNFEENIPVWGTALLSYNIILQQYYNSIKLYDNYLQLPFVINLAYGYQIGVDLWQEVMDKIKAAYPADLLNVGKLLADEITKRYHNNAYLWAANFDNEYDGEAEVLRKVDSFLSHNKELEKQINYYTGIDYSLNYFEDTTHNANRDKTTENNVESVQNSTTTGDTSKTTTDNSSTSQSGTDRTTQTVNHTVEFDLLNSATEDSSRAETTTTDTTRTPQLSGTSESTVAERGTDRTTNDTTQSATDKGTENEIYNSTERRTGNNRNWDEVMLKMYDLESPLTRAAIEFGTILIKR